MAGQANICCCCITYSAAVKVNTFLMTVEAGVLGYTAYSASKKGELISIIGWINFSAIFLAIVLHIRGFSKKTRGARETAATSILIANMLFIMLMWLCFAWIFTDFKSAFPIIQESKDWREEKD